MQLAHAALDELARVRSGTNDDRLADEAEQARQQHESLVALPFAACCSIRNHDDGRASGSGEIGRRGHARGELFYRRRLRDVERLSGGDVSGVIDQTDFSGRVAPREHVRDERSELACSDDRD